MEIASFFANSAAKFCLLSYWLVAGIWEFPSRFIYLLRISQRLANSLWAFPSGFPTDFSQCPVAVQQPLRAFPCGYRLKHGNIHPYSLKGHVSVNTFLKFEGTFKNFKKPQRLLS
jgi:hypothetical protein